MLTPPTYAGVPRLEVPGASVGGAVAASPHQLLAQDDPDFFDKLEDTEVVLGGLAPDADVAAAAAGPDLGGVQPLNAGAMDAMAREAGELRMVFAGKGPHGHAAGTPMRDRSCWILQ